MKNIKIASVKLINSGTSGIEIKYQTQGVKNNREFVHEDTTKRKAPIHRELEECFTWLKDHLLDICGYSNASDYETLKTYTEVTGITYGEKGFVISGKLSVLDRTKVIALNTPLIESSEAYSDFSKVAAIMDGIYSETKEYMAGEKVMTDEQLILKFNKSNNDFDPESVKHMTDSEKKEHATKILEDMGSIVIHNDEFDEDDSEETDLTELAKLPEKVPAAPKKSKVVEMKAIVPSEDDDFSIVPLLAKK